MSLYYITHPECLTHEMGPAHPECPDRLTAIESALKLSGVWKKLTHLVAPEASREQLALAHSTAYIDSIFKQVPNSGYCELDADTRMNPNSLNAALHAAGAGIMALNQINNGAIKQAFCAVRPPGHHAEHDKAMGFCLFNNIAITACYALSQGYSRVAVIDFDVHHGNGTEDIIQNHPNIMLYSSFQHPLYPYSGDNSKAKNLLNLPLPAYSDSQNMRALWQQVILPHLHQYQPDLILISAGFDAHIKDPLAQLSLNSNDYAFFATQLKQIAQQFCAGQLIAFLEGGYHLEALGESVHRFLSSLME